MVSPTTKLGILVVYLLMMIGIGYWATRANKSISDWLVTGNRLGVWVMGLSMIATTASGFAFIGMPGLTYAFGWPAEIWVSASLLGLAIMFVLLGKPMRMLLDVYDILTIPDLLYIMYDTRRVQVVGSLILLIGFASFMVVQWAAGARALEGLFPVSYTQGLVIMVVIVGLYTLGGGVLAASYTDFVQMIMMMASGILVFGATFTLFGGFEGLNTVLYSADPALTNVINPAGQPFDRMQSLSFFVIFGIALGGYVITSIRMFFSESVGTLKWGGVIAVTGYFVGSTLVWLAGLHYKALEVQGEVQAVEPDLVFPTYVGFVFPGIVAALIIAAILAAIMSTIDSVLVLATSALVHDLYEEARDLTIDGATSLRYHRVGMVLITVVTVALSFNPPEFIGLLAAQVVGFVVGSFFVPLVLGARWARATEEGALAALIVGFGVGFGGFVVTETTGFSFSILNAGGWAVVVSFLTMVVVSYVTFKEPAAFWSEVR